MRDRGRFPTGCAALLLLAAAAGCAPDPTPPAAAPLEPAQDESGGLKAKLGTREADLAQREAELAAREAALENDLARVERRLDGLERRGRPAAARATEPVPVPEALRPTVEAPAPAEPPAEPALRTIALTVPRSTEIEIEFLAGLSSQSAALGDRVTAHVARDLHWRGYVAIPAGSVVEGSVVDVNRQKKIGGQARLAVAFERVTLPSGESLPLRAGFAREGRKQLAKDAATIGGATAGGALLGRVLAGDRDKGTTIGAVVGAAVGTTVAYKNHGDPVEIAPGEVVRLALEGPVQVAVHEPAGTAGASRG